MSSIMPFHQRLAELWVTNQRKGLSEEETQEMYICLKANASYCWERAYLENYSFLASMTNDVDWQYEISLEIDNHQSKI
jgi:hypothetical protein